MGIVQALKDPFSYHCRDEDPPKIEVLSPTDKILHWGDRCFHEQNIATIARLAQRALENRERVSPRAAEKDSQVQYVGKFLKIARAYCPDNKNVERCRREFLAFKLGIPSQTLIENPEFEKFAQDTRLERQLSVFDHSLEISGGALKILHQGEMRPWTDVKAIALAESPSLRNPLSKLYNPPLKYVSDGLCNSNHYNWTELKPFKREEPPSWGARYLLEICALCTGSLRFLGDHTWIRLKTPEGDIYAPGIYREDNELSAGCSMKRGCIQNPDISEFWPEKIHKISFEITPDAFSRIKRQVEEDHRSDSLPFHIVSKNCTAYALGLAQLAGIHFSEKESVVDHFVPKKVHAAAVALRETLPRPLKGLATAAWGVDRWVCSVGLNMVQTILGATRVSPSFPPEQQARIQPHMNSLRDIFSSSKLEGRSPYTIAYTLPKKINEARAAEAAKRGVDPKEIRYWIPPQYRLLKSRQSS